MTTQMMLMELPELDPLQVDLPEPGVSDPRFRLSEHTRRLGLANVARARAILAESHRRAEASHRAA